jgi:hypothetical protein
MIKNLIQFLIVLPPIISTEDIDQLIYEVMKPYLIQVDDSPAPVEDVLPLLNLDVLKNGAKNCRNKQIYNPLVTSITSRIPTDADNRLPIAAEILASVPGMVVTPDTYQYIFPITTKQWDKNSDSDLFPVLGYTRKIPNHVYLIINEIEDKLGSYPGKYTWWNTPVGLWLSSGLPSNLDFNIGWHPSVTDRGGPINVAVISVY